MHILFGDLQLTVYIVGAGQKSALLHVFDWFSDVWNLIFLSHLSIKFNVLDRKETFNFNVVQFLNHV
jgi:hypothetical protein